MNDVTYRFLLNVKNKINRQKKINNPRVIMTLLVKNEEEVLETNLLFHKSMGVDGFIITDNNSTDETPKIIKKYIEKGWILEHIVDKTKGYAQVKLVDRMIRLARDKYQADWIMNVDADELWYCESGNIKTVLENSTANVIKCPIFNVFPEEGNKFWENTILVKKSVDESEYDIGKYSLYAPQIGKVIHRSKGYKLISEGNHNVSMKRKSYADTKTIQIFHYNIRNKDHFIRKMIGGGREVMKSDIHKGGAHWRYFYQLSCMEGFDGEKVYQRAIGYRYKDIFLKKGILVVDSRVKDYLENMEKRYE